MRLTQTTDYALRVLIYLAVSPDEQVTIREISAAYRISQNHLMKVVQQLAANGFVLSRRGKTGGIRLNGGPGAIEIGAVVRAMESDFALVECFRESNRCVITPACKLPLLLEKARDAFIAVLDQYTLADLVGAQDAGRIRGLLRIGRASGDFA